MTIQLLLFNLLLEYSLRPPRFGPGTRRGINDPLMNSSFRAARSGDPESRGLFSLRYGLFAVLTTLLSRYTPMN